MPPFVPRTLRDADLDRVTAIERDTFPDPWPRSAFAESLRRPEVAGFALDEEGAGLIGYGLCVSAADEGEILNLAIDPRARRRGAGRALVGAMLERLRALGAGRVYLEVRRSNEGAIALYRALGFEPMGARPAYYSLPREDAVTMVLDVTQNTARKG